EGFGAGSASDIVARLIGQSLSQRLGQSFIIENRAGASSNIATEAVVRAAPDGYTLLLITAANAVVSSLLKLNYNFIHASAPVAGLARRPLGRGPPVGPRPPRSQIHRLCQEQPRQDQSGAGGTRIPDAHGGRNFQDDGRRRPFPRALSRRPGFSRHARRRG